MQAILRIAIIRIENLFFLTVSVNAIIEFPKSRPGRGIKFTSPTNTKLYASIKKKDLTLLT